MKKNIFKLFTIFLLCSGIYSCSTYTVKKDINKNGELTKTPRWYVKYKRQDKKWIYETATSVSPDLELSVKKSIILAKSKLADRYNGKLNNEFEILKSETGGSEATLTESKVNDKIINSVKDTLVKDYIVDKVDVFYTHNNSYRSYVKVKISKENIKSVLQNMNEEKHLKITSNNQSNKKKLMERLNKIFN
tara:strand:- start:679 stop:1251 length:573 start_codon:yes stop_codon:yes gene_type:complete